MGVVLRRGAHHRRPADVDQLDRRVALERVEVADDKVDRLHALAFELGEMRLVLPVGEDAGVDRRVERLHPAVEHLFLTGDFVDAAVRDPLGCERLGRAAARHDLNAEFFEFARERDERGFVGNGDERPHLATRCSMELDRTKER